MWLHRLHFYCDFLHLYNIVIPIMISVTSANVKKAGRVSRNIVNEKAIHVVCDQVCNSLWTSRFLAIVLVMIMWTLITTATMMIIKLLIMQDNVQYTANISFPPVYFAGFIWACPLPRALHNIPWRTGVLNESERNRRRRVGCNSMSSHFRNYKVHPGNYHKIIKIEDCKQSAA